MHTRPRILIAHPYIAPPGGGDGLAAWAIQALRESYDVSIASFCLPDYDGLNHYFGTSLQADDFTHHVVPLWVEKCLDQLPTPQGMLRYSVLERYVARLSQRHHFDGFLSTSNEFCFPGRAVQYVHFPRTRIKRSELDYRWYHHVPFALNAYRSFCRIVGGETDAVIRANSTLCNSRFIADLYEQTHGVRPRIVFPPVVDSFKPKSWNQKKNRFVCLGRLHPDKAIPKVIRILKRVRGKNDDVELLAE